MRIFLDNGAWRTVLGAAFAVAAALPGAMAAEPIKIGFAAELTGPIAGNGKQVLLTAQIWAEEVNARGGLLGRKVELDYYDDQSNPGLVPAIYTKLIELDHVDLLLADSTLVTAAAMPTVIPQHRLLMAIAALAINDKFHYPDYFQLVPFGPDGKHAISQGYFNVAMTMTPKPKTIALVGADIEFSKTALDGARDHAGELKLRVVYDRTYPPPTTDFAPIVRAIKATSPDLIYIASYPLDTTGIINAISEIGLDAELVGGSLIGLTYTGLKAQLGEKLDGFVHYADYVHESTMTFPGIEEFLALYQKRAAAAGTDPLGYDVPPFCDAMLDILAQSITAVGSLDQEKLAQHIHASVFNTVVGRVKFSNDGEWASPRLLLTQFQHVAGHDPAQFAKPGLQVILDPPALKSGSLVYPFAKARQ